MRSPSLGSFQFENGEKIDDLKISYVTHGKLNAGRDNAILMLHSFAGDNHGQWIISSGPAKGSTPRNTSLSPRTILPMPELRADLSTGPTNSGLKMRFPRITARDWVNADYKLVKDYLGIDRLLAATGDSVGGITSLQLAVSHPDFVRAIIPIAGTTHTNPQTQLLLRHMQEIIALDPAWYGGMYQVNPTAGLEIALMDIVPWLYSSDFYMTLTAPEKVRDFEKFWRGVWSSLVPQDARDIYYQLDGWAGFQYRRYARVPRRHQICAKRHYRKDPLGWRQRGFTDAGRGAAVCERCNPRCGLSGNIITHGTRSRRWRG